MDENEKRIIELTLYYFQNKDLLPEDEKRIIKNALIIAMEEK